MGRIAPSNTPSEAKAIAVTKIAARTLIVETGAAKSYTSEAAAKRIAALTRLIRTVTAT